MRISVQVVKVFEVEVEGGDTSDWKSINSVCRAVEKMQSTEIERMGKLVDVTVQFAEVVGPPDNEEFEGPEVPAWVEQHSVNCIKCGKLVDERDCVKGENNVGDICPSCR